MGTKSGVRLAWVVSLCAASAAHAATFEGLGFLTGGTSSKAWAVSADGSVVVGEAATSNTTQLEAFRWTAATGIQSLGLYTGGQSPLAAFGVSGDGSAIGGRGSLASGGIVAFRWTESTGNLRLGTLSPARIFDVTDDGTLMVGGGGSPEVPHTWTMATGLTAVTMAVGATSGHFTGVSSDGAVLAGNLITPAGLQAHRWIAATQDWDPVPFLPDGTLSTAWDISADGTTIVGESHSTDGNQAFKWTAAGGTIGLGDLPGGTFNSVARGANGDGSVIIGSSITDAGREVFIWDAVNHLRPLKTVLTDLGVDLTGWTLQDAFGISDDGNTLAGWGLNPQGRQEAWVATLANVSVTPEPGSAALIAAASLVLLTRRPRRRSPR